MRPTKILFVNENLHGHHVLGSTAFGDALRVGLEGRGDVEARFADVGVAPAGVRLLARSLPPLDRADLDLQQLRWFAVQGLRTRALVGRELARGPVDVVHVNTQAIALGASPVPKGVPLLLSADATVWDWRVLSGPHPVRRHSRGLFRPSLELERRVFERAHVVFAYTEWARERIAAAAPRARVVTRRPGVDLERFRPAARRPRTLPRLLFVGGRFGAKGGFDLLEALGDLLGTHVELDVVTPNPPAPRPGLRTHRLGRSDPALLDLLQQADLFCLPTYADTMSFATMEALACGTPAVVSSVAGLPDVVGDAGITVPAGDIPALRHAIEALVDDEARRRALERRARALAEERFDARRQTALLLDRAKEAAEARRPVRDRPLTPGAA